MKILSRPQIVMILNINYNNTFYKLRFKFKNFILLDVPNFWYRDSTGTIL